MGVKSALGWFVRNVRETAPQEPVSIELERNREAAVEMGAHNPPDMPLYRFRLDLKAGFGGDQRAAIPVFKRTNTNPHPVLKEIFYCEVAGAVLEAANVEALREKAIRMLESLAPAKALPLAYFRVPAVDYALPVYEEGGRIVCPVIAGPKLKAENLSEMRQHAFRYLVNAGYVRDEGQVELRVLRPSDLRLVPPAAFLTTLDDPSLWLPTVEGRSPEGLVIGLLGKSTELRAEERPRAGVQPATSPPAATDVTALLRLVGHELVTGGRMSSPFELYAAHVRREIWARTEELTDDVGRRLTCWLEGEEPTKLEVPLRRTAAGELVTALEDQGICVFLEADEPSLARRLGQYLSGHGFLRWQDAVEVEAEARAPEPVPSDKLVSAGDLEFSRLEFGSRPDQPAPAREEEASEERKEQEEVRIT